MERIKAGNGLTAMIRDGLLWRQLKLVRDLENIS